MLRKILIEVRKILIEGSIIFLLSFNVGRTTNLEMKPYIYTQDFEENDPINFWTTNGKYTVNFKGLTEEKAFSGKKSFKLDITFEEGSYVYWQIPVEKKIPAEGRLKFSGYIYVGEESTGGADAGLGRSFCIYGGGKFLYGGLCGPFGYGEKGKWTLIEGDIVKSGEIAAKRIISSEWNITKDEVGIYIDRYPIFLFGRKGDRVVIYVDDIKIEGEVPIEEGYIKRWAPAKKRIDEKISMWEEKLKEAEKKINSLTELCSEGKEMKEKVEKAITEVKTKIEQQKKRGSILLSVQKEIDNFISALGDLDNKVKMISEAKNKSMIISIVSPISSFKILPDTPIILIPGKISNEIEIVATPGEYEPASFVIHALSDIKSLKVKATDLKGKKGVIPSSNIDIKVVKCWYQGGSAWENIAGPPNSNSRKVLVPELLLNDDTLIKVDYKEGENYLKLNFPEGEKYIWISNPKKSGGGRGILSIKDYPVKDASYLLPVDIPENTNKQFWVTLKVPENVEAGIYEGEITLSSSGKDLGNINIKLRVLPFKLASPKTYYNLKKDFVSSIYYRGILHPDYPEGSISSEYKSKEQLKAELKNMYEHGITNPTCYQPFNKEYQHGTHTPPCYQPFNKELLGEYLRIRNEVGMKGMPLYYLGVSANESPDRIKEVIEFIRDFGIPEVYFYGIDEARGKILKNQRPNWIETRKAGGKVFVASYCYRDNFEIMGDIQDLLICAGFPLKEIADEWHSVGHEIFCYSNPQGGVENPEVYRRNFGLLLWKANYDGAMTYAYQDGLNNIWNDFDRFRYRDHNFTYPTVDGVINTIALEGYREGIDDIRYATTLKLEIEKAKNSKDKKIKEFAFKAEEYLETLNVQVKNLDTIRLEIIDYILKLKGKTK